LKKKQNSLLDKLKQENQANLVSTNVLSGIEKLIPKLSPNSLLTGKIEEIKRLQVENNLDASNKIKKISSNQFDYKYPFYFLLNENSIIDEISYTENSDLITHIKTEAKYNQLKNDFKKARQYQSEYQTAEKNALSNQDNNQRTFLIIFVLIGFVVSYISFSWFLLHLIWQIPLTLFIAFVISEPYFKKVEKSKINEKGNILKKQIEVIKTKANNVYKT
jgi:hypothetical protein